MHKTVVIDKYAREPRYGGPREIRTPLRRLKFVDHNAALRRCHSGVSTTRSLILATINAPRITDAWVPATGS